MATCDPQALLNAANCFDCLTNQQLEQVQVQMLCDILNTGLAGGPFVPLANINGTINYLSKFTGPNSLGNSVAYEIGGLIGINTTAPVTEFQVVSTSASDPRGIMSSQYSTDTNAGRLHLRKARGTVAAPTTVLTGDVLGRIRFSGYDGAAFQQMASIAAVATGTVAANRVPTYMIFSTATDANPSVLTERVRILPDGNIGVGTSVPDTLLQVGAGVFTTVVDSYPLCVTRNSISGVQILGANNQSSRVMFGDTDNGEIGGMVYSHAFDSLTFFINGGSRLFIANDGKSGLSTDVPKSQLDIVGNLTVGATYGGVNAAPTSGAIIEGRVGIGTNSPNANSILDLVSTTLGFKLPTMTSAQKGAIANTAGLMVFDTDLGKACVNNGAGWQTITSV